MCGEFVFLLLNYKADLNVLDIQILETRIQTWAGAV